MRFDKKNAKALEVLRKSRPVGRESTLFGFDQRTLAVAMLATLIIVLLVAH